MRLQFYCRECRRFGWQSFHTAWQGVQSIMDAAVCPLCGADLLKGGSLRVTGYESRGYTLDTSSHEYKELQKYCT